MSEIARLKISTIRNLQSVDIQPAPSVNLFFGENGSGKTSLLEAIHLLSSGRSFRSAKVDPLISHDADEGVVYAELVNGYHLGLSKSRRKNHQLHFESQPQRNWESVARELPVQLLDASSFLLLEGGPRSRRRFLDWGVFHVEQSFLQQWRRSQKCLANRNFLLKQRKVDAHQLSAWDSELADASKSIDIARKTYFDTLLPEFMEVYRSLDSILASGIRFKYLRGWDEERALTEVLSVNLDADKRYGATQQGPHRAELDIRIGKDRAVDVLSRGQQKVLVCALKIAQGAMLSDVLGQRCLYLVDDLTAELDVDNRASVLEQLVGQGSQLFVTCVDCNALKTSLKAHPDMAVFHVERGTITA